MLLGMVGETAKKHMNKGIICAGIHKITEYIPSISRFTGSWQVYFGL